MVDEALPRALGRFELLEVLGQGAYGTVYRARLSGPLGFEEYVALKVLSPSVEASEPSALLALADEARILRHLRHPNIVGLRGFEAIPLGDRSVHALALEYVEGITIDDLLVLLDRMGRSLPAPALVHLFDETLAALAHAHDALGVDGAPMKIVHRDLKPTNLMVDVQGSVRVLDFGIAWARERLVMTVVGTTKGSPPWMSPEQVIGSVVDRRSDLWVLASIVYRLATGRYLVPPMRDASQIADCLKGIVRVRWSDALPAFRAATEGDGSMPLKRGDRKKLEALLGAMLAHSPDDRPTSAKAARQQLAALSCLQPEAGREVLSTICRGIRTAQGTGRADPDSTRQMQRDDESTVPGAAVPTG
jgi:serine/threonine protein kinase